MLYSIYVIIFAELFLKVLAELKLSNVPQIYPQKSHLVLDAQTDLTLGCRGAEPLRWIFRDDVNGPFYNSSHKEITNIKNVYEPDYKFETILTIYNVSHVNVGFYYCHGEMVDFDTPMRSSRIYIFVRDDNFLSVISSKKYVTTNPVWIISYPCRPTFPDVNITLTCDHGDVIAVNANNYYNVKKGNYIRVYFHSYYGFTIKTSLLTHYWNCVCVFKRNKQMQSVQFQNYHMDIYWLYANYIYSSFIEGPDTAKVGDNITLQCTCLTPNHYSGSTRGLKWNFNNILISEKRTTNEQIIKLKRYILLINLLVINNITVEEEGNYNCNWEDGNACTSQKFLSVNDKPEGHTPRIYSPNQDEIQVKSGENLTLRCEGSRPLTWFVRFHKYTIEHKFNGKNGLYESFLYIPKLRYYDAGYYYCYEKDSIKENPLKSDKIYIFVKDEQNLYVVEGSHPGIAYPYDNFTIPCIPTSREVNVSLSMFHDNTGIKMPLRRDSSCDSEHAIDPMIYEYDPRKGFIVQMPQCNRVSIICKFETETASSTVNMTWKGVDAQISEPLIIGPPEDIVFVNQTLELICTVAVYHNVPDDALHWRFLNNGSYNDINVNTKRVNVYGRKVLIGKLLINNITNANEGRYICYLTNNNATAIKYISVYDKFEVEPFIENLKYDYAYIGLPLVLRCKVNVNHNVGFSMAWSTLNTTDKHIMNMKYYAKIRSIQGEIITKIDEVTCGHERNYSCYAFDLTNRKKTVSKYVRVKRGESPRFVTIGSRSPESIDALINETVKLTCPTEGDPKPIITWKKGSKEVERLGQHIDFSPDNSELTIFYLQTIDAGLYTCVARNAFGQKSRTVNLRVKSVSDSISGALIAVLVCLIILFLIVAILLAKNVYNGKELREEFIETGLINFKFDAEHKLNPFLKVKDQTELLPYDIKWEIPRNKIKLGRNLGSGCFGFVVDATISNFFDGEPRKIVAVKMLHRNSNIKDFNLFISELKLMARLEKHDNLLNLLGACTENIAERKLLVVVEYCKHGSLRNYLLENRGSFVKLIDPNTKLICLAGVQDAKAINGGLVEMKRITTVELVRWALQVARGMEFLASRKVLHGDLALRNVLLAENYVAKISDFGLSRNLTSSDYYRMTSQSLLPIKWMAPESIRDKTFSTWSDVWSFGVMLWELFSLAQTPYAELLPDFRFYQKLESGYRLEQPKHSTNDMYHMMRECWHVRPTSRPTFPHLVLTLTNLFENMIMIKKLKSTVLASDMSNGQLAPSKWGAIKYSELRFGKPLKMPSAKD